VRIALAVAREPVAVGVAVRGLGVGDDLTFRSIAVVFGVPGAAFARR
jgi:hypothetical protein